MHPVLAQKVDSYGYKKPIEIELASNGRLKDVPGREISFI